MVAASLDAALCILSLPIAVIAAYLLVLTLLSRRPRSPSYSTPHLKFDVVVPAKDEEAGISATVRSLSAVDYPRALRRIVVVADNCTDRTADEARQAGALVLVRDDPERRGKGYALAYAFDRCLADGFADAIVVVDADTAVSGNLLRAFAARLEGGALAVQADNTVANPELSWRTGLMAIAFSLFNTLRSLARDRLGASVGLRGNGMCVATALLRRVPHEAFSVVEDLEYGIRLGEAGVRVRFAHEAAVRSIMVGTAALAASQRQRWEGGRRQLARERALPLLYTAIRKRNTIVLDLALDLLVPPLAKVAAAAFAGTAAAAVLSAVRGAPCVALATWGAALAALVVYVGRGWGLSGLGTRGLHDLARAPIYFAWKLGVSLGGRGSERAGWVRTARERSR